MDIIKILGIGMTAAMLAVLLKGYKPELAMQISLAAAALIFVMAVPYLRSAVSMFQDIAAQVGMDNRLIGIVIKIIGIAYLAQFGAELCKDAGEGAIASKIELAGKLIIMTMSMPIMYKLLALVNDIVSLNGR